MPQYKGHALVIVRRWIRAAGPDAERRLLAGLTEDHRNRYLELVATAWVPVDFANELYTAAAPILYPTDPRPLRRIGAEIARENLGGVLRFVLRVLAVETLVEKTAAVWGRFHDTGTAVTLRRDRSIELQVTGYPELPERIRETIVGWLAQAVELSGAKHVAVIKNDDPKRWTWTLTWR